MLKVETREIDGATYTVTQLDAWRAMRLMARIGNIVGPALAKAAEAGDDAEDMPLDKVAEVISALTAKLTPDELEGITKEMLHNVLKDDRNISGKNFGLEMAGQMTTVFKLLAFAFEVNYGDFFDAARAMMQKAREKRAAKSASTVSTASPAPGPAGTSG